MATDSVTVSVLDPPIVYMKVNNLGGADAVAAMTIILIYPELTYVHAFLVVHVVILIVSF